MLHGERYVYCNEQVSNNILTTTHIKAIYSVDKAPSYRRVQELGYYKIYIRQEKYKHKEKIIDDRRIEIRVPACELEALLKDAKLSYEDKELL